MWQSIIGAIGLLIAAGTVVWYKFKAQSTDVTIADSHAADAQRAQAAAEAQLQAKAEADRKALNDQILSIKSQANPELRQAAALALLRRLRGVD